MTKEHLEAADAENSADPDAARQSLPMTLTEEVAEYFAALDEKCIDIIQKDSERLLGNSSLRSRFRQHMSAV